MYLRYVRWLHLLIYIRQFKIFKYPRHFVCFHFIALLISFIECIFSLHFVRLLSYYRYIENIQCQRKNYPSAKAVWYGIGCLYSLLLTFLTRCHLLWDREPACSSYFIVEAAFAVAIPFSLLCSVFNKKNTFSVSC